jgi:hypothetical protein
MKLRLDAESKGRRRFLLQSEFSFAIVENVISFHKDVSSFRQLVTNRR